MILINQDSKLSEIIFLDPSTITVLDRFGITLGVGDARICDVCKQHDIDMHFLTTILNTFINESYFPQAALLSFSSSKLIKYLNMTYDHYEKNMIPNIERHFAFLIGKSQSQNSNLVIMRQFFEEVKNELLQQIDYDRKNWFPTIAINEVKSIGKWPLSTNDEQHTNDPIEEKIDDLINMLVVHLKGPYDHNLGYAVILAIFALKKDIKQNNRIRNRILMPISQSLDIKR